jgi:hypothetical protein
VNTNEFYERRDDRTLPKESMPQPHIEDAVTALAVHRDPSVPPRTTASEATPQRGIAWVRPSELPTLVGSKWANRGIDLQSELVRRSRRAPIKATKAGRRISRTAIARPEAVTPTVTTTEELGL